MKNICENRIKAFTGCILGTAVGDALGLPMEFIPPKRALKIFGDLSKYHFFFGKGMVSDDTEHTCMAAQSIIYAQNDCDAFSRDLARRFRYWFLAMPAGMGFATLRAIIKLWLGFSPNKSGVFSAGNGPAMRSAILGVYFGHDINLLKKFVRASTQITHTDPKAFYGSLAVALAAYVSAFLPQMSLSDYFLKLKKLLPDENAQEFLKLVDQAVCSVEAGHSTQEFANKLGLEKGVSGYVYHTVPVVLHSWSAHRNNYKAALLSVIKCGGDTDTTAAILGGIVGAGVGKQGIPSKWLKNFADWPRTIKWLEKLAFQLADSSQKLPLKLPLMPLLLRNFFFLIVVLTHGLRRIFPPYS